jgi:hypothetical protein
MHFRRLSDNRVLFLLLSINFAMLVALNIIHQPVGPLVEETDLAENLQLAVFGGCFIAQLSLVAFWAAFSNAATPVRCGVLIFGVPLLAAIHSQVFGHSRVILWFGPGDLEPGRTLNWSVEYWLFAWIVSAGAFIVRSTGVEVEQQDAPDRTPASLRQFGIATLLSWSLLVALVLGAGQLLSLTSLMVIDVTEGFEIALRYREYSPWVLTVLAFLLGCTVMAARPHAWTWALLLAIPILVSLLDAVWFKSWMFGATNEALASYFPLPGGFLLLFHFVFVLIFAGPLLIFRERGYRLRFRRPWWLEMFRSGPKPPPVTESP